jgi:hypothetical protein
MKTLILTSVVLATTVLTACTKAEDTKQITLSSTTETTNVSSVPISVTEKTVTSSTTQK